MGALDGILVGLVSDLLLAARNEVEDGVHPAPSSLPCLCGPAGRYACWV